jgi:predicted O-methyltransferase YrrM
MPIQYIKQPLLLGAAATAVALGLYGIYNWWRPRSVAKAVGGGTLTTHPRSYRYLLEFIGESDSERALRKALEAETRAGMMGSPDEAYFLRFLVELMGARRVIEVGVFRGTTTLQLAHGVGPGGEVQALDVDDAWLEAGGRRAWEEAGVSDRIAFKKGSAVDSMRALLDGGGRASFDFVFIDADKGNYPHYWDLGLELLRPGGVVAVDNVLWHGRAENPPPGDVDSQTIHDLNERIRSDPRVRAVMLGIADGVYLARKL